MKKQVLRSVLLLLGFLSLFIGSIGLLLPLLPTTPFLLLAAYFFLRSSPKVYQWLMSHRLFGRYLYAYLEHRAIDKKTKISALILLWVGLGISLYHLQGSMYYLLLVVGAGVTYHLLSLKTLTPQLKQQIRIQQSYTKET